MSGAADRGLTSPRAGEPIPGVFREEERYQALRKRRGEFQKQDRFLSDEEKTLSLSQLHRKWKDEAQKRANLRKESRPSDWDDLGYLEPEMMQWTKAAIRRVIWSRKQERWLERMRHAGIPVHTCDVCSRQVTSSHRCVPTGLAVPGVGDTPYSRKELVVAQQGKNLALKPKVVVDQDKLKGELERMTALLADKEALAAQQEHFTEALIGFTNALVAERYPRTTDHETPVGSFSTNQVREEHRTLPRDELIPYTQRRIPPLASSGTHPDRKAERRRRSSTSFPLQFLLLAQGSKEYYGLVDTGSQINVIDAALAPSLEQDNSLFLEAGATEIRGITGNNTAIQGWITVTLRLPTGESVTSPFALVDGSPAQIVIGLPFLHEGYLEHAPHEGTLRSPGGLIRLTLAPARGPTPAPGRNEDAWAPDLKPHLPSPTTRTKPTNEAE
ncbi:MAG: LOW QUALITY PROTEIN: hypothetical protein KVP17_004021 [Porospora cf. gigantea B]|uniref:uncharacterized protein n=1 Tax=Porospora cf. gigantea B TaxID=2853592 RepID=UPI003571CDD8|nr:MAG: LOW QUALITY PROTEIN: hypothetical protein KVP17_004021 [Porospora cf. gigantea B]